MFPGARWMAVAAVALGVTSAPLVTHALPVHQSDISAVRLAGRMHAAAGLGWSGEVRSLGSLQVPLTGSTFGGVARVLGGRTSLRVWWRDPETWRIDRIRATGESDLVRDGDQTLQWNYEDNRARFTPYSPVRLPDDVDVVPAALAARLLSGARPGELSRLPSRRIAGHDAAGLRLVPADERSTIARVDIWADDSSGLPLAVRVYAEPGGGIPVLSTELVALTLARPDPATVGFRPSKGLHFSRGAALDQAAGANVFAPFELPDSVAGLARRGRPEEFGAVGVYGRGPTAVLAIPLRSSTAGALHHQIARSRTSVEAGRDISLKIGPISVLLYDGYRANFLLTGTVTAATLRQVALNLARDVRRTE